MTRDNDDRKLGPIDRRDFLTRMGGAAAALVGASTVTGMFDQLDTMTARAAQKVLGVGQPDRTADFYPGFMRVIMQEAKKRGWRILQSYAGNSIEKQVAELHEWIAQGVTAIVVLPRDASAMGPIVQECKKQGIIFVGYANIVPHEDGFIVWDDPTGATAMGKVVGKFINENLGGKADVGMLTYVENQATRNRIKYSKAAIHKVAPRAQFFETPAVLAPEALKATQSLLQAHPNMKVIVCCADDGALGARAAYRNSGKSADNVFICGFDGSKENLLLIGRKDKYIRASAALNLISVGRSVVDIPDNILHHRKPTSIREAYTIVTDTTPPSVINQLLSVYGVHL
jgi:ribose transport system substrate-binding protein